MPAPSNGGLPPQPAKQEKNGPLRDNRSKPTSSKSNYQRLLSLVERFAERLGRDPQALSIHRLGRKGEDLAYWFLRARGYTIIARNYRHPLRRGEIDLIGWDGDKLAFVEVKTRAQRGEFPAEQAVDQDKRKHLISLARGYARRRGVWGRYRFDVVAVYEPLSEAPEIVLHKDAFREQRGFRTTSA
jgi:putative endonuclease